MSTKPILFNAEMVQAVPDDRCTAPCDVGDVLFMRESLVADEYADLWDRTIKPADLPRYGRGANPWVLVIELELCDK